MQEHLKKHRQTKTKQLEKIVSAALKASEADYKLSNVAYIWLIRDFNKKSLPDGRWSGVIYNTNTSHNIRSGCVIVYATCEDQVGWADDCEVVTMWTNANHEAVTQATKFVSPNSRKARNPSYIPHSAPRKKRNKVKFEDVMEKFFELRDDPDVSISQAAIEMQISYSKYFVWYQKYKNYTLDTIPLTIR